MVGPSGTGKTTLALQFLCDGVRNGERTLFVTVEEPPNEILWNHRALLPELGKVEVFDAIPDVMRFERTPFKDIASVRSAIPFDRVDLAIRKTPELTSVEVTISALEQMLRTEVQRKAYDRVVVDSLTALQYFCMKGYEPAAGAQSFLRFLSDLRVTTILTVESPIEDVESPERMLARGEIRLFRWELDGVTVRAIGVEKFRGSSHDVRLHPYRIGAHGIDVNLLATISRDTQEVVAALPAEIETTGEPSLREPSTVELLDQEVRDLLLVGENVAPVRAEVEAALVAARQGEVTEAANHLARALAAGAVPPEADQVVHHTLRAPAEAALARIMARAEAARVGVAPARLPEPPILAAQLARLLNEISLGTRQVAERAPYPAPRAPPPAAPAESPAAPAPSPTISAREPTPGPTSPSAAPAEAAPPTVAPALPTPTAPPVLARSKAAAAEPSPLPPPPPPRTTPGAPLPPPPPPTQRPGPPSLPAPRVHATTPPPPPPPPPSPPSGLSGSARTAAPPPPGHPAPHARSEPPPLPTRPRLLEAPPPVPAASPSSPNRVHGSPFHSPRGRGAPRGGRLPAGRSLPSSSTASATPHVRGHLPSRTSTQARRDGRPEKARGTRRRARRDGRPATGWSWLPALTAPSAGASRDSSSANIRGGIPAQAQAPGRAKEEGSPGPRRDPGAGPGGRLRDLTRLRPQHRMGPRRRRGRDPDLAFARRAGRHRDPGPRPDAWRRSRRGPSLPDDRGVGQREVPGGPHVPPRGDPTWGTSAPGGGRRTAERDHGERAVVRLGPLRGSHARREPPD